MDKKRLWIIALNTLILFSWIFLLADSVYQGLEFPRQLAELQLPNFPLWLLALGALVIPFVVSALTFWRRENVMEEIPKVTGFLDRMIFTGAYQYFMNRMYPVHASMVSSALFGGVGAYVTYSEGANAAWVHWSYIFSAGCFVFVIAMIVAVLFSRRYPPQLK